MRLVPFSLTWIGLLISVPHTFAGLYSLDEKPPIPVDEQGVAQELSFGSQADGRFPQLYFYLANLADENPARGVNQERQELLDRIAKRKRLQLPQTMEPADLATLAADLIRVGRTDEALNYLGPKSRDRIPSFWVLANFAHIHATRGEWFDAVRWHQAAFLDADFPDDLPNSTPEQRAWLKRIDREYYRKWLTTHRDRAESKLRPESEEIFPLFDLEFVNEAGDYEPGQLAQKERDKLPKDAIPIVQQLLLWAPWDTSLYWLLGELYAAEGRFREAAYILDGCAFTRQYSNRKVMMAHRAKVKEAAAKMPPEPSDDDLLLGSGLDENGSAGKAKADEVGLEDFVPRSRLIAGGVVFGLIAVVLIGLQTRAYLRRLQKRKTG